MSSFRFKITPERRQYIRLVTNITKQLEDLYYEQQDKGLEPLGGDILKGEEEMTLEALNKVAFLLDREIKFKI